MRSVSRPPCNALAPFVRRVWVSESPASHVALERVVPTAAMHVVVRLSRDPLVIVDGARRTAIGHAIIGGARSRYYVRSIADPSISVGAQLLPGVAPLLFGVSASELADRHTSLAELWGAEVEELRERLSRAATAEAQLRILERALLARVKASPSRSLRAAIDRLSRGARVADVVEASGASHRAFIAHFRDAVGLAPKSFARVARVQRAIAAMQRGGTLVEVAAASGYADQAHFTREMTEIAGVSPSEFRRLSPAGSLHVPLSEPRQISSRLRPRAAAHSRA